MASIINASVTSTPGLVQSADASGVLQLQSNGVTGLTVGTGGLLTAANGMVFSSMTLGTATAGEFEYDGLVPYFTPLGTQRGVIPGMQYYRLNSTVAGTNATGTQNLLGAGVTLSASTVYAFELQAFMVKTAGVTSHTVNFSWGGTATVNNIYNSIFVIFASGGVNAYLTSGTMQAVIATQTTSVQTTGASNVAGLTWNATMKGTVSVNAGGTLIPQYSLSAAPGGAYTTQIGSYMLIYPIGVSGANTNVGTWA